MTRRYILPLSITVLVLSACLLLFGSATDGTATATSTIRLWDGCDPETFNKAIGPGTCLRAITQPKPPNCSWRN